MVIVSTRNARARDAGALDSSGKIVTSEPGSITGFAVFMNGVVCGLIVDTDAQGTIDFEADGSKVRVMGRSKLSCKFTIIPATFACTVATLKGKY